MDTAELNRLLELYKDEQKEFRLLMLLMAVSSFFLVGGAIYAILYFAGVADTRGWWEIAALVWLILLVPPYMMLRPEKPTQEHVALNAVLNDIGRIAQENHHFH